MALEDGVGHRYSRLLLFRPAPRTIKFAGIAAVSGGLSVRNSAGAVIPEVTFPLVDMAMLPVFIGLDVADLTQLLQAAWVQHFSDGHVLFRSDDPAHRFYVVLDGHVELFVEDGARRNVLEIAARPMMVGEIALYGGGVYLECARIVGHSRLLVVPAAPFLSVLHKRFDLALRMLGVMSTRLHGLVKQITSLKIKSTAQRLAGFLLGIADTQGDTATAYFPYDKRLVAECLGMSAESLSRALARLGPVGVKSQGDSAVMIADMAALRAFCGEDDQE